MALPKRRAQNTTPETGRSWRDSFGIFASTVTARCPSTTFDRIGLSVRAKRLEQGRLVGNWTDVASRKMNWTGLKLLLEGIEPKQVRRRYKKTCR